MATKVRIKTDALRREITLESIGNADTDWQISQPGFKPMQFQAESVQEAVQIAMNAAINMRKDPNYVSKRAGNPNAFGRGRLATVNATVVTPAVQPSNGVSVSTPEHTASEKAKATKSKTATA